MQKKPKMQFKFDQGETEEESLLDVFNRCRDFMSEVSLNPNLKGKNIFVVTHTPLLKAITSALIALNDKRNNAETRIQHEHKHAICLFIKNFIEGQFTLTSKSSWV